MKIPQFYSIIEPNSSWRKEIFLFLKNFLKKNVISKILLIAGCFGSLFVCILPAIQWSKLVPVHDLDPVLHVQTEEGEEIIQGEDGPITIRTRGNFLLRPEPPKIDLIMDSYRNPEIQESVIEFFTELCGSWEVAISVLSNADLFEIPPSLAFALCWQESRFNPRAYNNANENGSIDRGLFQLNNRTFPDMEVSDFYNPEINAYYGMRHLSSCIDMGGTEIIALTIYNAGLGRVRNTGAPFKTLQYVSRIHEYRARIEAHFVEWEANYQEEQRRALEEEAAAAAAAAAAEPGIFETEEPETEEERRRTIIPIRPLGIW